MLLEILVLIIIGASAGAGGNRIIDNTLAAALAEAIESGDFTAGARRKLTVGAVLLGVGLLCGVAAAVLALS